jgi:hypothetical protein
VSHERAALQGVQELETRLAAFDAKEKTALRVGVLGQAAEVLWAASQHSRVLQCGVYRAQV